MQTQEQAHAVERAVETPPNIDIPDSRVYESEDAAELDRSLCDAIESAEQCGANHLAEVLPLQLASHYLQTR